MYPRQTLPPHQPGYPSHTGPPGYTQAPMGSMAQHGYPGFHGAGHGGPATLPAGNLIANPNFTSRSWNGGDKTNDIDSFGWNLLESGGDGWRLERKALGSGEEQCPVQDGFQGTCVVGSFDWCKRSQEVDLVAKGIPAHILDQERPSILVHEWFISREDCAGEFYLTAKLLDEKKREMTNCLFESGTRTAGSSKWEKVEHTFTNYPAGVRYVYFEDGIKDTKFWAGHYSSKMCWPTVKVIGQPKQAPFPGGPWQGTGYGQPAQGGYPGAQGGYPQVPGGYQQVPGGYSQSQGGYPQPPGYPHPPGGYGQPQGGYTQPQGGYTQQQGRYVQASGGYPQPPGGYPQQQGGYPQPPGGYPQQQGGYPQPPGGYPQQQGGYPQMAGGYVPSGQVPQQQDEIPKDNLIKNANCVRARHIDDGIELEFNSDYWEILDDGGNGWRVEIGPHGVNHLQSSPSLNGYNVHCLMGSFDWCRRKQLVNLIERGVPEHVLDKQKPPIHVAEWFTSRGDCAGQYEMSAVLLDGHKRPLEGFHFHSGVRTAPSDRWERCEHTFTHYPNGARFIEFQDGSKDTLFWNGHYGAKMSTPTIRILEIHSFQSLDLKVRYGNLLSFPGFQPKIWDGNTCTDFEVKPWSITSGNLYGTRLEKKPTGSLVSTLPVQYNEGDVWCIASDGRQVERQQVVDLVKEGIPASYLDTHTPPIYVYEWFLSAQGCRGTFRITAQLLDEYQQPLAYFRFNPTVMLAADEWRICAHTFHGYPRGVRYVVFGDCGGSLELRPGPNGVKMFGAYVGLHPPPYGPHYEALSQTSVSPQTGIYSHHGITAGMQQLSVGHSGPPPPYQEYGNPGMQQHQYPEAIPPIRNLLKNPNLQRIGETEEIDMRPWEELENGGDRIRLQKTPSGSKVEKYPAELGPVPHCIATSFDWFRRRQVVDLCAEGYSAQLLDNQRPPIYCCEWFTGIGDWKVLCRMEVHLLDEIKNVVDGCTFEKEEEVSYSDRWRKIEHRFTNYLPGVRYVSFEDGGKDTLFWAGHYGAKMVGASVFVGF